MVKIPHKKGMKHISLRDNHIREYFHLKEIDILHIYRKLNVSEIFTKELHDGAHFRSILNSFIHPIPWI